MTSIYENSQQHIKDELRKLDLMLQLQVSKINSMQPHEDNIFQGVCLSKNEIDALLRSSDEIIASSNILSEIENISSEIEKKKSASIEKGIFLGLPALSSIYNLSMFEELAVLICLAPELDWKYGRIYAYLNNDVTQKYSTVGLILDLACSTFEDKHIGRLYFGVNSPLTRYQILSFVEANTLLSRPLKIDERIVQYILGLPAEFTDQLLTFVHSKNSHVDSNLKNKLVMLLEYNKGAIVHLRGTYGAGKKELAEAVCSELDMLLLTVDTETLVSAPEFDSILKRCLRETLLLPVSIYFDNFDALLGEENKEKLKIFLRAVDDFSRVLFTAGEMRWEPRGKCFFSIELPFSDYTDRISQWDAALDYTNLSEDVDIEAVASRFRLTEGQIIDAAIAAENRALLRNPEDGRINSQDLYSGCKAQSNQRLSSLARKIDPFYTWNDIVLPPDAMDQLEEICNHVKYRQKVYGEWGFERKLSLGKGLNVLFSGPSGSGKTMAAEIIANELTLDLYKIDLSSVVSKYIGETEKNLSRIFQEAETSNAILFFDEADALFGKRSEAKDSHDRYANIEINYLLQRMEEYEGMVILATNLKKHLDEAFHRRMHFMVDFPFPDESHRLKIWKSHFPNDAPIKEIDWDFLAKQFKVTGGNIKNIVLNSAFLAAGNSGKIDMEHVILATKREYEKIGKTCVESDFGKYYPLIRAEK